MMLAIGCLIVLVRVVCVTLIAPILGNQAVPMSVRLMLAAFISLAIAPVVTTVDAMASISRANFSIINLIANEALIGTSIGLGVLIIFSAAVMIGTTINQISGLQTDLITDMGDDLGPSSTARLIGLTATTTFVISGGLESMLTAVIDSFASVPIGHSVTQQGAVATIVSLLQQSFELTVRAVAPAVATLLVSTVVVSMMSRTMPQLNTIQVGLSSNISLMWLAVLLSLSGCVWLIVDAMDGSLVSLEVWWQAETVGRGSRQP